MSFFSRSSTKSAASSVHSLAKGKEVPEPTSKIFTTPPEGISPKKKWEYNEEQSAKIAELREYTSTLMSPESDPYYPWEARFLADPGCHPRYMRAAKWKLPDAKNRIKGTIEWRREFKPELIVPDEVSVEAETGKIILTGFDEDARPILYLRPGRENTETSPRQIRHLIYHLERAIDLMPPGQEQVAIIVDYKSATSQSNPSISTGRKVLSILQNHYVERLGRGSVVNMSWWINAFFTGISPFLDPITRDKIRFNPKLEELVPVHQSDCEFGGQYNFQFDHEKYWKTLTEFCRLGPDGCRLNLQGEKWYPPLGNGIKAAMDGLVPRKGSVVSGDVVKADDPDADTSIPGLAASASGSTSKEDQTAAERIVEQTREGQTTESNGEANGESDEAALSNGLAKTKLESGEAGPVPAVETKPGGPVGDFVFDHPPTTPEINEALRAAA